MNESRLIAAAQRGDISAFNQLVQAYQESVYHMAYRVLGERTAAARATQASFLSAYRTLRSLRGGSFRLWLFCTLIRVCRQPRDTAHSATLSPKGMIAVDENDPSLDGILQMGLARLPMEERITVILSDQQGFAYDEIAQITGTTWVVVQSRLNCARDRLRRFLLAQSELIPTDDRLNNGTTDAGQ